MNIILVRCVADAASIGALGGAIVDVISKNKFPKFGLISAVAFGVLRALGTVIGPGAVIGMAAGLLLGYAIGHNRRDDHTTDFDLYMWIVIGLVVGANAGNAAANMIPDHGITIQSLTDKVSLIKPSNSYESY